MGSIGQLLVIIILVALIERLFDACVADLVEKLVRLLAGLA